MLGKTHVGKGSTYLGFGELADAPRETSRREWSRRENHESQRE